LSRFNLKDLGTQSANKNLANKHTEIAHFFEIYANLNRDY